MNKSKVKISPSQFDSFFSDASSDIELEEGKVKAAAYIRQGKEVVSKALIDFKNNINRKPMSNFGVFLELLRRQKNLTREELANVVDVDVSEIIKLEIDSDDEVSPRTLYQLEKFFKLKENTLGRLCGVFTNLRADTQDNIVKYAARAKHANRLNTKEQQILNELISLLNKYENS